MSLTPHTRFGHYEIIALLGAGGMGEVYRATDNRLKRQVAIKVLASSTASDTERLARFQREAQLLATLNHPHIAAIYGVEEHQGVTGLVMELVEGQTLAEAVASGPLPVADVLRIAQQLAGALEAAHEQGIVHRDLKPANIKVRSDGTIKVLDFGLAKNVETGPPASVNDSPTIANPAMTTIGAVLGTAAYMSPEQARGRPADRRADIWAFGVVVYEMLVGRPPFGGDHVSDIIASVLTHQPDWSQLPETLPPTLARFLQRCLERDVRERVRDIGDVRLALNGAFDVPASAIVTPPALVPGRAWWIFAAMVVLAAGAAAITFFPPRTPSVQLARFEIRLPAHQNFQNANRSAIAIAPDGATIAYRALDGIHVRAMGRLEPTLVPGTSAAATEGSFTAPFFSPDGQWIGYFADDGLKKIGVSGGAPQTLVRAAPGVRFGSVSFGASWSASNVIVYGHVGGVMRVSGDGGTPELIVPARPGEQLWSPQLLPGGDAVLYTALPAGTGAVRDGEVVVHSLSSGRRTAVVSGASDARYVGSGHLIYGARHALLSAPFDARQLAIVGPTVSVAENVQRPSGIAAGGTHYAISDNGTLVYSVETTMQRSLEWVNRDGTSRELLPTVPSGAIEDPRLSPDGSRVVLTRDGDIWIYDLQSGRANRLTKDGNSQMPAWNPGGTLIAYSSKGEHGLEAWVAPTDESSAPRQLTNQGGIVHVDSWSPDGRLVAVHRHSGGTAILMIAVDTLGGRPTPFAANDSDAESATFARDGRHVAYLSTDTGIREIFLRPYPGPGARLTVSVNGGVEPIWAANGEVFYRNSAGDRMFSVSTRMMPAMGVSAPTLRFEGSYYVAPTGSPRPQYDVTADGQRLLMVTSGAKDADTSTKFVVIQNWLSGSFPR